LLLDYSDKCCRDVFPNVEITEFLKMVGSKNAMFKLVNRTVRILVELKELDTPLFNKGSLKKAV